MKPPKETTDSAIQAEWWGWEGVIYFFGAGNPPVAIKIGVAALTKCCTLRQAVQRRLRAVQSSNHELIEVLGLIHFAKGQYPTRLAEVRERELHVQFASLQRFYPGSCGAEWFTSSAELLEYIRIHTRSPEDLGVPRFLGKASRTIAE